MLRNAFLVFIACWIAWFLLDKPAGVPYADPPEGDRLLIDFQVAFDMLKAGYPAMAFVFIWKQHSILLSLLGGVLVSVVAGQVGDMLGRRRMRRLILPKASAHREAAPEQQGPEPAKTPDPGHKSVGDKRVE